MKHTNLGCSRIPQKPYKLNIISINMAENAMPVGFGGLMRYKEEYDSKFKFGPGTVVAIIILVIAFVTGLRLFYT